VSCLYVRKSWQLRPASACESVQITIMKWSFSKFLAKVTGLINTSLELLLIKLNIGIIQFRILARKLHFE
jgi:hypothetical protein